VNTQSTTIQCPKCFGTERNQRGGPWRECKATGQVSRAVAIGAAAGNLGRAMLGLAFFGMIAVFLIAIAVAIIISVV